MMKLNDGRDELWQWDTGRKLTVDADCSEVHFSNRVYGRSVDVPVVDGIAKIPDVLLQMDNDLYAWGFVGTPEDGYTKISKVLHINRRNKPADYVFTPPEQTTLDEILGRINAFEQGEPERITTAIEQYLTDNPITAADVNAVPQNQGVENAGKFMGVNESGEVVPVDAPSGGSGTDIALGISGAAVGQIARITAVDENGKPTAWEPVDMPSGWEWHLIRSFTVPVATNLANDTSGITWFADEGSNVFGFEINTDENGNAFSYHELYMRVRQGVTADAGDLPATIYINDIKIGQWNKAQIKLINRIGEVKISRYANTYTVSYAGLSASTSERNWVSSPALSNGIGFINSTDGAVEGNINKFKMLFEETNYMRADYLVSLWGR